MKLINAIGRISMDAAVGMIFFGLQLCMSGVVLKVLA